MSKIFYLLLIIIFTISCKSPEEPSMPMDIDNYAGTYNLKSSKPMDNIETVVIGNEKVVITSSSQESIEIPYSNIKSAYYSDSTYYAKKYIFEYSDISETKYYGEIAINITSSDTVLYITIFLNKDDVLYLGPSKLE